MTEVAKPNPFVGPRPFELRDSEFFVGREREAFDLVGRIIAHEAVVLHAASGAGKTSLLNAAVMPKLEDEDFEVLPIVRLKRSPVEGVDQRRIANIYTFHTLASWVDDIGRLAELTDTTIDAWLLTNPPAKDDAGDPRARVLVFDQFEELFTLHATRWREREPFLRQIGDALRRRDPPLRVLLSLREDYLAHLDAHADCFEHRLEARMRLPLLRQPEARQALVLPLAAVDRRLCDDAVTKLVDDLATIRVRNDRGETESAPGEFIEPVQLQVVGDQLFGATEPGAEITVEMLETIGDVDEALGAFYARCLTSVAKETGVAEHRIRSWVEQNLVTAAGTRSMVVEGDGVTNDLPNEAVEGLVSRHLVRGEVRHGARWLELCHDRFLKPVQEGTLDAVKWQLALQNARSEQWPGFVVGPAFAWLGAWTARDAGAWGWVSVFAFYVGAFITPALVGSMIRWGSMATMRQVAANLGGIVASGAGMVAALSRSEGDWWRIGAAMAGLVFGAITPFSGADDLGLRPPEREPFVRGRTAPKV